MSQTLRQRAFTLIDMKLVGDERRAARRKVRSISAPADVVEQLNWNLNRMVRELEKRPDLPPAERHSLSDMDRKSIPIWRSRGWSLRRIAEMYDCSHATVARICGERS